MIRSEIRDFVRELAGVLSSDVVSDALINRWINESYNEVARERTWDWLEATDFGDLPPAVDGRHTVVLPNGSRRIVSAYLVSSVGHVREMVQVPELDHVMTYDDDRYPKYDVTFDGTVTVAPEQPAGERYRIRYTQANVSLTSDSDSPVFDSQFHAALAYRAAVKVLSFVSDDTDRAEAYFSEFASLIGGMIAMYELSHDSRPFQMGESGQAERRYFPWFRPA